ncbi:hypothetical protein [uncultured Maribacter sp.]|uniref:hypothetical protein n=1 Tax=uncultured Maribacter sp. TaxID=431308 RepID=UPI002627CFD3|nr:hypothetical protein [uncultured Maribacter sp.]
MRNILLIILISVSTSSFSQVKIDTSEIKSIRYEWRIDLKTKDSTLTEILTEYNSGIFKEEYPEMKNGSKFGHYHIFNSENLNRHQKTSFDFYVMAIGNVYWRNYYDKFGVLDSINKKLQKEDTLKILNYKIKKRFKNNRNGKLEYLINEDGDKDVYKYNLLGKLKTVYHYRDSKLYRIKEFKNGLLVSEKYPQRKKYRKQYTYEYNNKNQLTKKDESDYDFYKYMYNEFGIERVEKIYKKRNSIMEYELFEYSANGELLTHKIFSRNNKIRTEYHYLYK